MKTKQIAFTQINKAELLDVEIQPPRADEVQVKLARSTISSGTERANLTGEVNIGIGPTPSVPQFPRILGYSSSGTVTAAGSEVKNFKVGDRVCLSWTKHMQYINVQENLVYRLPENIGFDTGALVHICTFPLAAIRKCRLEIGESAVVMGMGLLGRIAVKLLRAAGACPVIAVDPDDGRRVKALEEGADYALNPFDPGFSDTVKKITGGGAKVGIEVTGNGPALDSLLDCMARFGRIALLGCTRHSDFTIDYYKKIHGPGITLIGAHTLARPENESHPGWWSLRDDALAVLSLVSGGRIELSSMVEEVHSPDECEEVYSRLAAEKSFPIVQFDWNRI